MTRFASPADVMRRAVELAQRGLGAVEPNPLVGAVIVNEHLECLGEGWHQQFGGPHAEIHALNAAGASARGATLFVTLEPCCHVGKTPPCTKAVISAGIKKVIAATSDPNPQVAGQGMKELAAAGIEVEVGLLKDDAEVLIAPFRRLILDGRPWVIAKWAMTLDGKIATSTGDSRWITGEQSRAFVHELRGRVDGIMVGIGTALADDPLLTARPPGLRTATRIIVDNQARLPTTSKLMQTASETLVLIAVADAAPMERIDALQKLGAEIVRLPGERVPLDELLRELGRRRMTNVLVEGGGGLVGGLFDRNLIDEVHAFVSPKIIGGQALTPVMGVGIAQMANARNLTQPTIRQFGDDVLISGRLQ